MLPTPWLIYSWFRTYKWLFFLFTCHCVPDGRVALASRLTHRTRLLEENYHRPSLDKQPGPSAFGPDRYQPSLDYEDRPPLAGSSYRSIEKRYGASASAAESDYEPQHQPPAYPAADYYFDRAPGNAYRSLLLKQALKSSATDLQPGLDGSTAEPASCTAPDNRSGLCYEATDCAQRGGIPMGRCDGASASAASVCCLFESTCGGSVAERHAYFRSPMYPRPTETSQLCRLKVHKTRPSSNAVATNICQLKLSFVEFDIAKPVEGNCTQDIFSVSGQNENNIIPRICGYNSGQHYYIAVDESGLVNLQLVLRGHYPRKFDIHIEQLECGSKELAPPHCLQYYDSTAGQIKSFNYDARRAQLTEDRDMAGGAVYEGYPNNVDYLICIRKETGFCSVSYEFLADGSGSVFPFSIGAATGRGLGRGATTSTSERLPISFGSTVHSTDCEDDYLIIGGLRVCSSRLLGGGTSEDLEEHVTLSSTTTFNANPGTAPSTSVTGGEGMGNGTRNGELMHETMDETLPPAGGEQTVQQDRNSSPLRRPHRRADYQQHYFFADRLGPSRTRATSSTAKRAAAGPPTATGHIMATDFTPGPFQLRFVANGVNNAKGFYLAYRQNPCRD